MHQPNSFFARGTWLTSTVLAALLAGCASAPPKAPPPSVTPAVSTAPATPTPPAPTLTPASTDEAALHLGFTRWVEGFVASARAAGISETVLKAAFSDVRYLPRVVELDRAQPEFTRTVWAYLDTAVSPQRVMRGQDKLLEVRAQADAAAARFGVPASIPFFY